MITKTLLSVATPAWIPLAALLLVGPGTLGYGQVLVVDQQVPGESGPLIQVSSGGPLVRQGFYPRMSAIGFVQLGLWWPTNNAVMAVNLRERSTNGSVIATTADAAVQRIASRSVVTLYFPTNVVLTPGNLYFLEPVVRYGASVALVESPTVAVPPPRPGPLYVNGDFSTVYALVFWEGIVVPKLQVTLVLEQGALVYWDCAFGPMSNAVYALQRSSNLATSFTDLATNLWATPPRNVYWDSTATNARPYFYRVKVQ